MSYNLQRVLFLVMPTCEVYTYGVILIINNVIQTSRCDDYFEYNTHIQLSRDPAVLYRRDGYRPIYRIFNYKVFFFFK